MEYKTLSEVTQSARVSSGPGVSALALRRERLQRLAALLEAHRGPVRLLARMEYLSAEQRAQLRADPSPLTIAFRDPALRAAGLKSDRLGDAMVFFMLNEGQTHHLLCDCHYPATVTAEMIAGRIRAHARKPTLSELWGRVYRVAMRSITHGPTGRDVA
jgi:hypothetical protein